MKKQTESKYWWLSARNKTINALDVRSASGLEKVGNCLFIVDRKYAVVIMAEEDPCGREYQRLDDLLDDESSGRKDKYRKLLKRLGPPPKGILARVSLPISS